MSNEITTEAELDALYGRFAAGRAAEGDRSHLRPLPHLHRGLAFVVLATSGPEGMDCSPRGDPKGFVRVVDRKTLMIPDRRGNNRVDTCATSCANPRVACCS